MKKILVTSVLALLFAVAMPLTITSCAHQSERVTQVQTLKAVGHSAEAAVALSAQLYRDKQITKKQARDVLDFYDQKFQPTFQLAVAAARANLDSIASPDVLSLAAQLSSLVISFQKKPPTP